MIVNAYLNVTPEQWEEIKGKYVEPNMSHVVSDSKRKTKRCDHCGSYCECTSYEGFCYMQEGLVDGNGTCEEWHE